MKNGETKTRARFYFSLPRLIARQLGRSDARTESNWLEANVAGGLAHLIWYAFAADVFLRGLTTGLQIALLLPLAILVWIGWLIALYINSVVIRLLRACGLFGKLSNARMQGALLGILTTAFAAHLMAHASLLDFAGLIWIVLVALNLLAAAVFVVSDAVKEE